MSPSDMPDFDNMSPEEMMRWMESLAKRQGATEGFTTDADMEVGEVRDDDERLAGQGEYIPHGWSKEKWEAHLAKEEEEKQRKAAAQQVRYRIYAVPMHESSTDTYRPRPFADRGFLVVAAAAHFVNELFPVIGDINEGRLEFHQGVQGVEDGFHAAAFERR